MMSNQTEAAQAAADAAAALAALEAEYDAVVSAVDGLKQREVEIGNALEDLEQTIRNRKARVRERGTCRFNPLRAAGPVYTCKCARSVRPGMCATCTAPSPTAILCCTNAHHTGRFRACSPAPRVRPRSLSCPLPHPLLPRSQVKHTKELLHAVHTEFQSTLFADEGEEGASAGVGAGAPARRAAPAPKKRAAPKAAPAPKKRGAKGKAASAPARRGSRRAVVEEEEEDHGADAEEAEGEGEGDEVADADADGAEEADVPGAGGVGARTLPVLAAEDVAHVDAERLEVGGCCEGPVRLAHPVGMWARCEQGVTGRRRCSASGITGPTTVVRLPASLCTCVFMFACMVGLGVPARDQGTGGATGWVEGPRQPVCHCRVPQEGG
jgi:hypothetical protein